MKIFVILNLISGMKIAIAWIWTMFERFCNEIASNDLLLYPVIVFIVIAVIGMVIAIVRKFGLKSRRS